MTDEGAMRRAYRWVVRLLESRTFSFYLLGAWIALLAVWLVPFQVTGQPTDTIESIAQEWLPLRIVYVLLGLATITCTLTRLRRDIKRARTFRHSPTPTPKAYGPAAMSIESVAKRLSKARYVIRRDDGVLHAARNVFSPVGGSVFHLGIVVFGIALALVLATSESATLRVTEGQTLAETVAVTPEATGLLPDSVLGMTLESIEPEYFEDVLLFTRLDARLATLGRTEELSLSDPLWVTSTSLLSIQDYGLAPHIEITRPDGSIDERVVAMAVFPPGSEDRIDLEDVGLGLSMIVYPDYGVVDGRDVSLSYNIVDPAFLVSVETLDTPPVLLERALLMTGEQIPLEDYALRISGLSRYGTFRIVHAPFIPLVGLGLLMMALGIAWRIVLRRHDVVVWQAQDGVYIDGWSDVAGRDAGRAKALALLEIEEPTA